MIILIDVLFLVLGMFIDAITISYLVLPILIPVLHSFHVDPLWYGVIFVTTLAIGQATPPVGVNLFTVTNLIKGNMDSVAFESIPFILTEVLLLIVLSLIPWLSLFLSKMAGLYSS